MNTQTLDTFTKAYIGCALWTSTDNSNEQGGELLDANYNESNIAPTTLAEIIQECSAGFWDRGLGEVGKTLTAAAKAWGTVDLYVGDDGQIYA